MRECSSTPAHLRAQVGRLEVHGHSLAARSGATSVSAICSPIRSCTVNRRANRRTRRVSFEMPMIELAGDVPDVGVPVERAARGARTAPRTRSGPRRSARATASGAPVASVGKAVSELRVAVVAGGGVVQGAQEPLRSCASCPASRAASRVPRRSRRCAPRTAASRSAEMSRGRGVSGAGRSQRDHVLDVDRHRLLTCAERLRGASGRVRGAGERPQTSRRPQRQAPRTVCWVREAEVVRENPSGAALRRRRADRRDEPLDRAGPAARRRARRNGVRRGRRAGRGGHRLRGSRARGGRGGAGCS